MKQSFLLQLLQCRVSKFVSEGDIIFCNTVRVLDMLRNVIVSVSVTFYQINKFFLKYSISSLLTKGLPGPVEMSSRAAFVTLAVLWRTLL